MSNELASVVLPVVIVDTVPVLLETVIVLFELNVRFVEVSVSIKVPVPFTVIPPEPKLIDLVDEPLELKFEQVNKNPFKINAPLPNVTVFKEVRFVESCAETPVPPENEIVTSNEMLGADMVMFDVFLKVMPPTAEKVHVVALVKSSEPYISAVPLKLTVPAETVMFLHCGITLLKFVVTVYVAA
jgi:hypothetical protein